MSTKCTLVQGKGFHLFEECFEEDAVYLELEKAEFEASNHSVKVRIPIEIWEVIRRFSQNSITLDLSHEELYLTKHAAAILNVPLQEFILTAALEKAQSLIKEAESSNAESTK